MLEWIEHLPNVELINGIPLINDDCFNIFPSIPDKSLDAIIADLPYGTTQCKWDSILPLDLLWKEYERMIKDTGVILLFAQTPFDKILGCSNLKLLKYEWIWEKTQATGFLNAHKMPMKAHENILVFYKKSPTYNPQMTHDHEPMHSYLKSASIQNKSEVYGKVSTDVSGGGSTDRFPRDVYVCSSDKQRTKLDGTIHPTQKPLDLLDMFVKTYTNENDIILDNVMGSGTTCLASLMNNRICVGIEKEKNYYDIAIKRIRNYLYL